MNYRITAAGYKLLCWMLFQSLVLAAIASIPPLLIIASSGASKPPSLLPFCKDGEKPGTPPKCRPLIFLPE